MTKTLSRHTNSYDNWTINCWIWKSPHLKSYILRITASIEDTEDIVQDTFIRASTKLDTFRAEKPVKTVICHCFQILQKTIGGQRKDAWKQLRIFAEKSAVKPGIFSGNNQPLRKPQPVRSFWSQRTYQFCLTCISKVAATEISAKIRLCQRSIWFVLWNSSDSANFWSHG